jgi:hypothetical protein
VKELAERIQKQVELDDQRRRERERAGIDKFDEETPVPGTKSSKMGKKEPVRAEMILKVKNDFLTNEKLCTHFCKTILGQNLGIVLVSLIFKLVESIGATLRSMSQPALPSRVYQ